MFRIVLLFLLVILLTDCGGGKKKLFMPDSTRWTDQDVPLEELDTAKVNTDSLNITEEMKKLFSPADSLIEGRPVSFYLNRGDVSPVAKDFYSLRFTPSDNNATSALCDSLLTKNDTTRSFYYFLFLRLMKFGEGELAVSNDATEYCTKFVDEFYRKLDMPQYKWSYSDWVERFVAVHGNAGGYILVYQPKNAKHLTPSLRRKITEFADSVDKFENPKYSK